MSQNQFNAISAIKIAEKILGINDSLEVDFKDQQYFSEKDISAVFVKEGYYLVFNNAFLENASLLEIMITGFHETRHAYQYMQIEFGKEYQFKYPEEQSTLVEWKKDFDNPKQPGQISKEEYLNRPTEIDSIAFSYYLADKLLNVNQVIPDEVKDKVFKRVDELNKKILL